jgi:hypothetical protein
VGALELSTNQLTHFYAERKSTDEMVRLLETASAIPRLPKVIFVVGRGFLA